jgi:hypothetical protein
MTQPNADTWALVPLADFCMFYKSPFPASVPVEHRLNLRDLIGMCGFAVMLGVGRALYGGYGARLNVNKVLGFSSALAPANWLSVAPARCGRAR